VAALPEHCNAAFSWQGKVGERFAVSKQLISVGDLVRNDAAAEAIAFGTGTPALEYFPLDAYQKAVTSVLRHTPMTALRMHAPHGLPALRAAIAARNSIDAENIMIVSGGQQGIDLIAQTLVDGGTRVIVERPADAGAIAAYRAAGATLVDWSVTATVDELEDLIIRHRPRLIHTHPTHQNPSGRTLDNDARRDLLALATRYRTPVVEDGTWRELSFKTAPPPPLVNLDTAGVVIHVNTFSKTLAPGLRLGWIAAPPTMLVALIATKQRADILTDGLSQAAVARLLISGVYDEHLVTLRRVHRERADIMMAALRRSFRPEEVTFDEPTGGLHLWVTFPNVDTTAALPDAINAGVTYAPGALFYATTPEHNSMRICFSGTTADRTTAGVRRLADTIQRAARRARPQR
jgi:DNA-binding transcriptional MocR family regulator